MQLGAHPFFRSFMERAKVLGNNPVVEKVGNLREDIRERWETTENPTVQRFQVSSSRQQACAHICSQTTVKVPSTLRLLVDAKLLVGVILLTDPMHWIWCV